jgi:serine O-acetyltransferase
MYDALLHTYQYLQLHLLMICSCHIRSNIPKSSYLPHPVGIVIGRNVNIGKNVHIYQHVTLTSGVTVKDNARILTGSIILNKTTVGKGAVIGANSVVLQDVDDDAIVAGIPASPLD